MTGEASPHIIRSKLRPPQPSDHVVARPRIEQRLRKLIQRHAVVIVSATAGPGKTTAVKRALAGEGRLAWLTLDDGDVASGRLLTYVEAALAGRVPEPPVSRPVRSRLGPHTRRRPVCSPIRPTAIPWCW